MLANMPFAISVVARIDSSEAPNQQQYKITAEHVVNCLKWVKPVHSTSICVNRKEAHSRVKLGLTQGCRALQLLPQSSAPTFHQTRKHPIEQLSMTKCF